MRTTSPTAVIGGGDRARHSTPIRAQPVQLGRIRSHYHCLSYHRQALGPTLITDILFVSASNISRKLVTFGMASDHRIVALDWGLRRRISAGMPPLVAVQTWPGRQSGARALSGWL